MTKILACVLCVVALAGCKTTEERIAQDDQVCLSYGVPKGSPEYTKCRASLDQQRSDRQALQGLGRSGGLVGVIDRASQ